LARTDRTFGWLIRLRARPGWKRRCHGEKEEALRVHVGDSELVGVLLDYFEHESDCVAIQVGEAEIEVSLLGSYGSVAHNETVDRLLAEFRRRNAGGGSPLAD
jgi:hypothetical protein